MAKLHTFEVGYCTHPACLAIKGASCKSMKFPAKAYLLEMLDGYALWDTGYSQHFHNAMAGTNRLYGWVTPVYFDPDTESLQMQLKSNGVSCSEVRNIFISHFHADHIAGIRDFPNARFWASETALKSIEGLSGVRALLKAHLPTLLPDDFRSRVSAFSPEQWAPLPMSLSPFTHGWQVCRHGEMFVVPLPGHAAGHVGAFVQTVSGWVLLASDASWAPSGFTSLVGPSELSFLIQDSRAAYYDTLQKLHELHQAGIPILLSHA